MIKEAIILAGGLGTRLRPVISDLPKCMAPINGIPFINFILSYLLQQKVERFILSVGYKNEIIIEHIGKNFPTIDVEFVIEENPLGTGGAVKKACNSVKGTDTFILNGDTLFNINLSELSKFHRSKSANFTMALKELKNFSRYGSVETNADSRLINFNEKTDCKKGKINAGVYALNVNSLKEKALPVSFSFEKEYLEKYFLSDNFYGLAFNEYFIDIGIPEDYDKFNTIYMSILTQKNLLTTNDNQYIDKVFFDALSTITYN